MKTAALAFVLLIISVSGGEPLRCNRCVPRIAGSSCTNTQETCSLGDVCGYVIFTYPRYSYFKRCMKPSEVFAMQAISSVKAFSCTTDLCN